MTLIFVSFFGRRGGVEARGWVVVERGPIKTGADMEDLHRWIESNRNYDQNTVGVVSFQRLEQ